MNFIFMLDTQFFKLKHIRFFFSLDYSLEYSIRNLCETIIVKAEIFTLKIFARRSIVLYRNIIFTVHDIISKR